MNNLSVQSTSTSRGRSVQQTSVSSSSVVTPARVGTISSSRSILRRNESSVSNPIQHFISTAYRPTSAAAASSSSGLCSTNLTNTSTTLNSLVYHGFTSHGKYGFKYNGRKVDGLHQAIQTLFFPLYSYQKAYAHSMALQKQQQQQKQNQDMKQTNATSVLTSITHIPTTNVRGKTPEQRLKYGQFRGIRLDQSIGMSLSIYKSNRAFYSNLFANYRRLTLNQCADHLQLNDQQFKRLPKTANRAKQKKISDSVKTTIPSLCILYHLLNLANNYFQRFWKVMNKLELIPIETQVLVGLPNGNIATHADLICMNTQRKHIVVEIKSGSSNVYFHTPYKMNHPFELQNDCIENQDLIQTSGTALMAKLCLTQYHIVLASSLLIHIHKDTETIHTPPSWIISQSEAFHNTLLSYQPTRPSITTTLTPLSLFR